MYPCTAAVCAGCSHGCSLAHTHCLTISIFPVRTRGLQTLAVLSGVTSEEKLLSPANTVRPDFYSDTIADMFPDL